MTLTFTRGDLTAAAAVVLASALEQERRGRTLWPPESVTPERLARHYPAASWHVAWRAGQAVGAFSLLDRDPPFWPDDAPDEARYLHKLAVHPQAQGGGLAGALLDHATQVTREAGCAWLKLDTAADRPALRRLYEDYGFEPMGERDVFRFRVTLYRLSVAPGDGRGG